MNSSFLLQICFTMALTALLSPASALPVKEDDKTEEPADVGDDGKTEAPGKASDGGDEMAPASGKVADGTTEAPESADGTEAPESGKAANGGDDGTTEAPGSGKASASGKSADEGVEGTTDEVPAAAGQVADGTTDESGDDGVTEKTISQVHHTNCTFQEYFCNPTADDLIDKIEESDVQSAEECSQECLADKNCKYFTFINFRGNPACYLLKSCNERKPRCTVPSACVSGHRTCQNQTGCPKLDLKEGHINARWRCEGVNPYVQDIPEGTACDTYCPSWKNAAGSKVTAMSTCQSDGSWSDPISFPPGPLSFPSNLTKPDGPDMACGSGCQPLNITYNPNLEKGAEFFCNSDLSWSDLPAKIETTNQCHLLCDKMVVAITECKEDIWTGRPNLGFWCSQEQEPVGNWLE